MKKKIFTLLTLLATVCSGAWAGDVTTLYGRAVTADAENGYTAWNSSNDVSTSTETGKWKASASTVTCDATYGLQIPTAEATETATYSNISPTTGAILTYDAVWGFSTGNKSSNVSYIKFGNITITACGKEKTVKLNAGGDDISLGTTNASRWSDELTIHMVVNTFTNKITTLTVTASLNSTTINYTNSENIDITGGTYTSLMIGTNRGQSGLTAGGYIKSIRVKNETQSVSAVNYTVKFQDGSGNTLKDDAVYTNGVVGEVYTAPSSDLETFYNAGSTKKYIYKSGQNTSTVATSNASDNVITLVFDVYDKTAYTVEAQVSGSDLTELASGSAFFDGSTSEFWSKYISVDDNWYVASESTYGAAITSATTNVAYTATDAIDYFFEFEDMSNNGAMLDHTTGTSVSGGNSQRFSANGKNWTTALAGGTYTVNTYCNGNNGKTPTLSMYYCDIDGSNVVYIGEATACKASTWELKTTTNVVIPDGKALCFFNNSSYTHNYAVDYITLVRTGDATVSKSMTSAGWATFCSPYALDFSGEIEHLTNAYIITGATGSTLNLTSVKGGTVAANTGILLEGTEGTITIPVVASGTNYSTTNKLVGVTAATAKDAESIYVLMGSPAVGFYKNTNAFTVGANTAYLPSDFATAREFYLFDGETTGINAVKSAENNVQGEVYNLAGQRVAQPTKGLYIVNGKKVVIK